LGFDRMAWWPKRSTRSTNHHQVPDASMATRAPRGTWAKNRSSCRGSFSSRCCVTSPSGINTASCELRLCKSTPTCTIASVSFRRVGLASGRAYSRTPREANALMASSGCGPPQPPKLNGPADQREREVGGLVCERDRSRWWGTTENQAPTATPSILTVSEAFQPSEDPPRGGYEPANRPGH